MNDDVRDELRRLRARAYGPRADIADDPAALARLHELERLERPPVPEPAPSPSRPVVDASESPTLDDDLEPEASIVVPEKKRRLAVRSRRVLWAWAVSIAVVAALSSAATAAASFVAPVSNDAGVPQVATLEPDPTRPVPGIFGPASSQGRAYPDFHGLTAFVAYAQFGPEGERNACIFLAPTDALDELDTGGYSGGYSQSGCGAGVFPATAEFVVNSSAPETFRAAFPVGSSVQFVFDGTNLGVFSDVG